MIVKDVDLLIDFAQSWRCEWCKKPSPRGCHPHHFRARGMGGGARLDVSWNLISLCPLCHLEKHNGNIQDGDLLAIIAQREQTFQWLIRDAIHLVLRLPKETTPAEANAELAKIGPLRLKVPA